MNVNQPLHHRCAHQLKTEFQSRMVKLRCSPTKFAPVLYLIHQSIQVFASSLEFHSPISNRNLSRKINVFSNTHWFHRPLYGQTVSIDKINAGIFSSESGLTSSKGSWFDSMMVMKTASTPRIFVQDIVTIRQHSLPLCQTFRA